MSFQKVVTEFTIPHEGGGKITRDPNDPGGVTKYGIAKKYHPTVDVENLDLPGAVAIYSSEYWKALHCDSLPDVLAMAVFDTAVNPGQGHAAKFLQEALNVAVDGDIGPATLRAAMATPVPEMVAKRLVDIREQWYRDHEGPEYVHGLVNRCADLRKFLVV